MAATDYNQALVGPSQPSATGLIQALEKRGIYVIPSSENPTALNPGFVQYLAFNGVIFWYDSTDATTAHDGVTCIVTADGKRYKSDQYAGVSSKWIPVLDKDLTAPPGSPTVGDTYIVAAGGTGAWAAKDKMFATWAARGWSFYQPKAFDYAYVRDESLIYHYSAGGVWTSGIPAITIADNSITLQKLKWFPLGISVENQTTNAPPGGPADGVAYIVGGAPSGAWTGQSLKVAIWDNAGSAWKFFAGYEGAVVYDKALNAQYTHNGATWTTLALTPEIYLGRVTLSGQSTIDWTGLSSYHSLRFKGYNCKPGADDVTFQTRIASVAATFLTNNYTNQDYNVVSGPTAQANVGGTSAWNISNPAGSGANLSIGNAAADGGLDFEIWVNSFSDAQKTKFRSVFEFGSAAVTPLLIGGVSQGWHTSQTAMVELRFLFSGGTLASGIIDGWATP